MKRRGGRHVVCPAASCETFCLGYPALDLCFCAVKQGGDGILKKGGEKNE